VVNILNLNIRRLLTGRVTFAVPEVVAEFRGRTQEDLELAARDEQGDEQGSLSLSEEP
jgi:hypothetical protein